MVEGQTFRVVLEVDTQQGTIQGPEIWKRVYHGASDHEDKHVEVAAAPQSVQAIAEQFKSVLNGGVQDLLPVVQPKI